MVFNSLTQSKKFDQHGKYIKMWCPELKGVPADYIHDPWNMTVSLQKTSNVAIGDDYPNPIKCLKYTDPEVAKKQKREAQAARKEAKQSGLNFEKKTISAPKTKKPTAKEISAEKAKLEAMRKSLEEHAK